MFSDQVAKSYADSENSNMALRLSGQNSSLGVVFFVSKSLLGIEGQKKL